jgi:hypothetical protein
MRKIAEERVKMFKFMQEDAEIIDFKYGNSAENERKLKKENENAVALREMAQDQGEKLKKVLRSEDVFNVLKDMPHEMNVITGDGGWKNEVIKTGSTVYLFPSLQMHGFGCDDDFLFMKKILGKFPELYFASGYMAFPDSLLSELSGVEKLSLLTASPYVYFI